MRNSYPRLLKRVFPLTFLLITLFSLQDRAWGLECGDLFGRVSKRLWIPEARPARLELFQGAFGLRSGDRRLDPALATEAAVLGRYPKFNLEILERFIRQILNLDSTSFQSSSLQKFAVIQELVRNLNVRGVDDFIEFMSGQGNGKRRAENALHLLEELTEAVRVTRELKANGQFNLGVRIGCDAEATFGFPSFDLAVYDLKTKENIRFIEVKTARNRFVDDAFELRSAIQRAGEKAKSQEGRARAERWKREPYYEVSIPIVWPAVQEKDRNWGLQVLPNGDYVYPGGQRVVKNLFDEVVLQLNRYDDPYFKKYADHLDAINLTTTNGELLATYLRDRHQWSRAGNYTH